MIFKTLACTVYNIWHTSIFIQILFIYRGITPERENSDKTKKKQKTKKKKKKTHTKKKQKTCLHYISIKNPYMIFQNPSMHGS